MAASNPSNCFAARADCQFAAGDVRNSEHGQFNNSIVVHICYKMLFICYTLQEFSLHTNLTFLDFQDTICFRGVNFH